MGSKVGKNQAKTQKALKMGVFRAFQVIVYLWKVVGNLGFASFYLCDQGSDFSFDVGQQLLKQFSKLAVTPEDFLKA